MRTSTSKRPSKRTTAWSSAVGRPYSMSMRACCWLAVTMPIVFKHKAWSLRPSTLPKRWAWCASTTQRVTSHVLWAYGARHPHARSGPRYARGLSEREVAVLRHVAAGQMQNLRDRGRAVHYSKHRAPPCEQYLPKDRRREPSGGCHVRRSAWALERRLFCMTRRRRSLFRVMIPRRRRATMGDWTGDSDLV